MIEVSPSYAYKGIESKCLDQPREQRGATRDVADDYVLVLGVSACAIDSQPIQHRHAKRCDEVSVRSAAHRPFLKIKPNLGSQLLCVLEQGAGFRRANQRRAVYSAAHLDASAVNHRLQM